MLLGQTVAVALHVVDKSAVRRDGQSHVSGDLVRLGDREGRRLGAVERKRPRKRGRCIEVHGCPLGVLRMKKAPPPEDMAAAGHATGDQPGAEVLWWALRRSRSFASLLCADLDRLCRP